MNTTWMTGCPIQDLVHSAVTGPGIAVDEEIFQLGHVLQHVLWEGGEQIVSQVQMLDGGDRKLLNDGEGAEGGWVELLDVVALQVDQP